MKCRNCSKDIPSGFTDCPWCGEPHSSEPPSALPAASRPIAAAPPAPSQQSLYAATPWIVFAMSFAVVTLAAYVSTTRKFGSVSLQNSAWFIGAWCGPYVVSAIIVLAFYLVTRKKAPDSTKLFAACSGASLFALLSLLAPAPPALSSASHALPHRAADAAPDKSPSLPRRTPTIWDPAIISLFTDLKSSNEAYVAAVSNLDLTAKPLYTPQSFRDAATIQRMLAQLRDRQAVADQFSSTDPILAKIPSYVGAINASEKDKAAFLATFMLAVQQLAAYRKTASAYEHDWLASTIALYQFMQAHPSAYTISADGQSGNFTRPDVSKQFAGKMQKAQQLKHQFLQANATYVQSQNAIRTQMGMPE